MTINHQVYKKLISKARFTSSGRAFLFSSLSGKLNRSASANQYCLRLQPKISTNLKVKLNSVELKPIPSESGFLPVSNNHPNTLAEDLFAPESSFRQEDSTRKKQVEYLV